MSLGYRNMLAKAKGLAIVGLMSCSVVAYADDVADSERMLCSISKVTLCVEDGDCFPISVFDVGVPQFLIIDLKNKVISTTEASGENRESKVAHLFRESGRTFLQGIENNRAYSFLIEDDIGHLSASVTRDGITISAFGACTDANVD